MNYFIHPYLRWIICIMRVWGTQWVLDCGCPRPHLFFINNTIFFTGKRLQEKRLSCVGEFHRLMRRGVSTGSDTPWHLHHLPTSLPSHTHTCTSPPYRIATNTNCTVQCALKLMFSVGRIEAVFLRSVYNQWDYARSEGCRAESYPDAVNRVLLWAIFELWFGEITWLAISF